MRPLSEISANLELRPDGVWTTLAVSPVSYPDAGNQIYFGLEDTSFWFRHRNRCILEAVHRFPPPGPIFDIGGGNGFVARALQDADCEVVLVEPGPGGASNALGRGIRHVVRASFGDAGFLPATLPAIGLFDVLEHVEAEREFLASLARCLEPGGRIYLTVPAFGWLWSQEDEYAGHFRRYTLAALRRALRNAGLEVEYATGFFGFLLLPSLVRRVLPYRLGWSARPVTLERVRADHQAGNAVSRRLLDILTARELRRIRRRAVSHFGASILAVARKPS